MKQVAYIAAIAAAVAGMVAPAAADHTNNLNWTWARDGGTGGLVRARAVATDPNGGHSCVAGTFAGAVSLGPSVGVGGVDGPPVILTAAELLAGFVVQYNDAGQVLWAYQLDTAAGGDLVLAGIDIASPALGVFDCIVAGTMDGPVSIETTPGGAPQTVTPIYANDGFVARFGAGALAFVHDLVGYGLVAPESVSANDAGTAIYVGGYYDSDTFDFLVVKDTTPGEPVGDDYIIVNGDGGEEGFVVRYDGAGEPQWAEVLGGPGHDRVRSVAAASGKVFVAGSYENGMTLDMWWAGNIFERTFSHAFAIGPNPFLLPLDSADGRAHWTEIVEQGASGPSWYNHVYVDELGFGGEGAVMVTGTLSGSNSPEYLHYRVVDFQLDHRDVGDAYSPTGESRGVAGWLDTYGDDITVLWLAGTAEGQVSLDELDLALDSANRDAFVHRVTPYIHETLVIDGAVDVTLDDVAVIETFITGYGARTRAYVAGVFPFNVDYTEAGSVCLETDGMGFAAQIAYDMPMR
ncbi:hypothetical protein [Haliangium sp.]|uniref:hypothetical protein n=1 Tax=Haliangium sp. TaxID=2663208 RepID=UPI003D09FE27